jgi:hypothetical protein
MRFHLGAAAECQADTWEGRDRKRRSQRQRRHRPAANQARIANTQPIPVAPVASADTLVAIQRNVSRPPTDVNVARSIYNVPTASGS